MNIVIDSDLDGHLAVAKSSKHEVTESESVKL